MGIMEYECRTAISKPDIGSDQALYVAVKPRGNPKKDGQYKNYYCCHTCNQPGHFARECTAGTATVNYSNAKRQC